MNFYVVDVVFSEDIVFYYCSEIVMDRFLVVFVDGIINNILFEL